MIKAVLFDLDGTLIDTSEGIIDSVRYTISQLGYEQLPIETILKFVGPPIQNSLITYVNLTLEEAQKGANIFRDYYKNNALYKASVYPGIKKLLLELKNSRIKIGVATYKREDYAIDLLKYFGIADYCDVIHGADNENKLTKADIVEMCINELDENKSNVLLIGDTIHDAKGAYNVSIGFIAVTWGFGYKSPYDKIEYPCITIVKEPKEISKILISNN